jgi:hypothetical protein
VTLRTNDAQLVQSSVELPSTKAKFWRLTWVNKSAPFELTSVTGDITPDRHDAERSSLIVLGISVNDKRQEFSFDLGARLPVNQIIIGLPEPNSVAKIQVFSRGHSTEPWRPITHGEFTGCRSRTQSGAMSRLRSRRILTAFGSLA